MEPGDESILSHLRRGSVEYCVLALLRDGEAYGLDIGARLSADGIHPSPQGQQTIMEAVRAFARELVEREQTTA